MSEKDAERLGRQLADARRARNWGLREVARRTARQLSRVSEMESGRANPALSNLVDAGHVLGMTLMFVPDDRLKEVMALVGRADAPAPAKTSVYDELAIADDDVDEEVGHAGP